MRTESHNSDKRSIIQVSIDKNSVSDGKRIGVRGWCVKGNGGAVSGGED